jgi:hypothetical protein
MEMKGKYAMGEALKLEGYVESVDPWDILPWSLLSIYMSFSVLHRFLVLSNRTVTLVVHKIANTHHITVHLISHSLSSP